MLSGLVEAFVLRDASDLFRVDRLDAYRAVLELAARQAGNLVNLSEIASLAGVSRPTVARFLDMMQEAHVLRLVPAFAGGKRREVSRMRKVYFLDNGLMNAVLGKIGHPGYATASGAAYENWVFTELVKTLPWNRTVRYWRSLAGAEVDFVLGAPGSLAAIEVKAAAMRSARITRSARSFIDAYSPRVFIFVNGGFSGSNRIGKTEVRWCEFHDFPDTLRELLPEITRFFLRAETMFELAQALESSANQGRRARLLAEQARALFAAAGAGDREREASAWLEAHRKPR